MRTPSDKSDAGRTSCYRRPFLHTLLVALAVLLGVAPSAVGQSPGTPLSSGEVKIELESFGVGNVARCGDWCGIRLRVQDTGARSRELIVRINGLDFDGDTPLYQRETASNPGQWQSVWIYVRLPFNYNPAAGLAAYVYEAVETSGVRTDEAPTGFRAGRLLGFASLSVSGGPSGSVRESSSGLIAMIGTKPLGLRGYSAATPNGRSSLHSNEIIDVVMGISPAAMPDRWVGLLPFEAVVWAQGSPAELRDTRARALREYVQHGGHLIIILPSIGQTWTDQRSNELFDIMPTVSVARKEVADFERYRPLITRPADPRLPAQPQFPKSAIVHTFRPSPEANPGEAVRVLNGPDGDCVVVRRLVGAGAVTLVGLDLNQTALSQFDLIDADIFWHRILGKRGDFTPRQQNTGIFGRKPWNVDQDIDDQIAENNSAAAGVLLGFVIFVLYWLVAAPLGFLVLKRYNLTQHSWLAFVGAIALFTGIAWSGANLLRQSEIEARHFTVLDHVYGQPVQRAKTWSSIWLPWYGTALLSVAKQDGGEANLGSTIASWDPPAAADGGQWGGFPDQRGYVVDTRDPSQMRVPVRSTVKQVEVTWAGGPAWEMPRPARVEEGGTGKLELLNQTGVPRQNQRGMIEGTLLHNMPGTLTEGLVVVIRGQRRISAGPSSAPICEGEVFSIGMDWPAGQPLDLAVVTRPRPNAIDTVFTGYLGTNFRPTMDVGTDRGRRMNAMALFSQLPPPDDDSGRLLAQRDTTHGWDLSYWFTQPCVIVMGQLTTARKDVSNTPVPILVNGEPVVNNGRTFVRWIYPLPDDPPGWPQIDVPLPSEDTDVPLSRNSPSEPG